MHPFNSICSKIFRSLLGLACVAAWTGCQPDPVAGQVFVVTPSGESLRLGSVRVQIFDAEQVEAHLRAREDALAAQREGWRQELSELETLLEGQLQEAAQAEEAYFRREAEIRGKLSALLEEVEKSAEELQRQIASNEAFIASRDTLPPAPEGVPTRQESEEYEKRRSKWLSMTRAERLAWADALAELNADLENDIERLIEERDRKVMTFGDELQELDRKLEAAEVSAGETRGAIQALTEKLSRPVDTSDYLVEMPAPVRELRTDAEGEFAISLPSRRRYVLLAEAERRFGGEVQQFKWFVRVGGVPDTKILLSNHNLVTIRASENVLDLSAEGGDSET